MSMQYPDSVERSAELLRKALPLMSRQSAALHPVSYAVWYAYVADEHSALRQAVDAHLAQHGSLDEATTLALFRRHVAELDPEVAQRVAQGLLRLVAGMSDSAAEARDDTARFGQSLDRLAAELRADTALAAEAGTLDVLRDETLAMQQAVDRLQNRLSESQREIDALRAEVQQARSDSLHDALTGLPNRRAFDQRLADALQARAVPGAQPVLLMLDIDHFKRINDSYGHGFGDQVLRGVAQVLKSMVGEPALAARVGGEEFAVLLPLAVADEGLQLAERLRSAISASRVRRKDSSDVIERITVSLGVAVMQAGDEARSFIDRADRALYRAKAEGRDRVQLGD